VKRKLFIAGAGAVLSGCAPIGTALNDSPTVHRVLNVAEKLTFGAIGNSRALAPEYREADISPVFRVNGLATPSDATYTAMVASDFKSFRLWVGGDVAKPRSFSLRQLAEFDRVTQITRHDCVEGWSVIGKWSGVRLGDVVDAVEPRRAGHFVVFHCIDRDDQGASYYESLDLEQAHHPQTILATSLNGAPLDPDHGAPVRLRIPTQLGYKSAKWVQRIEVVPSFARIRGGHGGYWEDQGYEWYAGM
jgi:DMSO/TMAO reductase YedYZ molybdopterin-dependent catalytic subunit